jgi:hypothetical protein
MAVAQDDKIVIGQIELTFNCRVIFVDEVALYQLDGQAGLSDSSSAHHDELVFSQKLCRRKALLAIGINGTVHSTRCTATTWKREAYLGGHIYLSLWRSYQLFINYCYGQTWSVVG